MLPDSANYAKANFSIPFLNKTRFHDGSSLLEAKTTNWFATKFQKRGLAYFMDF